MFVGILFTFANNAHSALIQWDAFNNGDGLAVKDESTGLVWLDLSVTSGLSYQQAGSFLSDWTYAGFEQVESLLTKAFVHLQIDSTGIGSTYQYQNRCSNTSGCYNDASQWQTLFGFEVGARYYQTHSFGLYMDEANVLRMGGSYLNGSGSANLYGEAFNSDYSASHLNTGHALFGTFLVKLEPLTKLVASQVASPVSEPSFLWLFILLLIGFIYKMKLNYTTQPKTKLN